jgi:hypothetical protein
LRAGPRDPAIATFIEQIRGSRLARAWHIA